MSWKAAGRHRATLPRCACQRCPCPSCLSPPSPRPPLTRPWKGDRLLRSIWSGTPKWKLFNRARTNREAINEPLFFGPSFHHHFHLSNPGSRRHCAASRQRTVSARTIDGNVTDPSQAALVAAKVVVTEQANGFVRETVTNSAGVYTLPNLPPGTYTVTISSSGFQPYTRTGVVVTVQTTTRVDAALTVGGVTENVTVSAETAVLQTDRADVRFEIGGQSLNNLPVPIGRNYQMLFATLPGVSTAAELPLLRANPPALWRLVSTAATSTSTTPASTAPARGDSRPTDVILYIPAMKPSRR